MDQRGFKRCKTLMIFFNIIFLLSGLALFAVGIWIVVDFGSFSGLLNSNSLLFIDSSYIAIAIGATTVLLSLCGCIGAWKESKCLLIIFIIVLLLFILVEVAALILAFVFTSDLEKFLRTNGLELIRTKYSSTDDIGQATTSAFDYAQHTFDCCGLNNGTDYAGSFYDASSTSMQPWPLSCCVRNGGGVYVDANACLSGRQSPTNSNAFNGCYTHLRNLVVMYAGVVGGLAAAVVLIQILAIIFASCVSSNISEHGKVEAW